MIVFSPSYEVFPNHCFFFPDRGEDTRRGDGDIKHRGKFNGYFRIEKCSFDNCV